MWRVMPFLGLLKGNLLQLQQPRNWVGSLWRAENTRNIRTGDPLQDHAQHRPLGRFLGFAVLAGFSGRGPYPEPPVDPLKMGSAPKIKGPWPHFLWVVETPGLSVCQYSAIVGSMWADLGPTSSYTTKLGGATSHPVP